MEILYVGGCPYEDNEGEVLNLQVRLEEGEILTEGGKIQIEMMDDSVIEREVKIINPKWAGDFAAVSEKAKQWKQSGKTLKEIKGPGECGIVVMHVPYHEVKTEEEIRSRAAMDEFMKDLNSKVCISPYKELNAGEKSIHDFVVDGYSVPDKVIAYLQTKNAHLMCLGLYEHPFKPVPAWQTAEAMEELCKAFEEAISTEQIDPLILIPMYILDFLCIHPFNDGNGRMSRLLTLLLLYRAGYVVGKYISIEKLIENTKESYYGCLQDSSIKWHENENNYEPFVRYMLSVVVAAYRDFSSRVKLITTNGMSKPERVREIIKNTPGTITKTEILERCPDISQVTVQRALADLVESGEILKIGGGRYTKYTWSNETIF